MIKLKDDSRKRLNLDDVYSSNQSNSKQAGAINSQSDLAQDSESVIDDFSELNNFSKNVIEEMINSKIPPTPENFEICFNKLLITQSKTFHDKVSKILTDDKDTLLNQQISMEKEIKQGFSYVKNIFNIVAVIYKNLTIMQNIIKKRINSIKSTISSAEIQAIIKSLDSEFNKLNSLMNNHINTIKDVYANITIICKNIDEQSNYNTKFGVYNKKYFLYSIHKEIKNINDFGYDASIILIKVKHEQNLTITNNVKNQEILIQDLIALIRKECTKNDILAYYDDMHFGIVLRHTNLDTAKQFCDRLSGLLYGSKFGVDENGSKSIELDFEICVSALDSHYTAEQNVCNLLDGLPRSGKNFKRYEVINPLDLVDK